jgi:integrase
LITGKGDRQRVIPLVPPAVEALGAPEKTGPVFAVFSADYLPHRFVKAAKAAGVKARLHDLRHTCLTWLVAHGIPLKLVQEIAGHSDIKTTLNYAKTFAGGAYETLVKAFKFTD